MRKMIATGLGVVMLLGMVQPLFAQPATGVVGQETVVDQFLVALSNPLLISVLLVLGILALLAEISAPGGYVAGFVGVVMVVLSLVGLYETSANWFGLGLILLAFALFILELKTPTLGVAGVSGAILLFAGLLVLFNTGTGEYTARLSLLGAALIAGPALALVLLIARLAAKEALRTPITGREQLIGRQARARDDFRPHNEAFEGNVFVLGEIWRARSAEPVRTDDWLVVQALDGLTLTVAPAAEAAKKAATAANGAHPS